MNVAPSNWLRDGRFSEVDHHRRDPVEFSRFVHVIIIATLCYRTVERERGKETQPHVTNMTVIRF